MFIPDSKSGVKGWFLHQGTYVARTFCDQESPPLRTESPKPVKQDERFCFPLLLPTHTFFHKQLFFRIIELLEPNLAGIPPPPTGSMRPWDNSLSIHAESGISQSNLEFAMTGSFARWWIMRGTMDSSPCHSPVAIVTTPSESCSPYPGSRSTHEAVHHSPYI